MLARYQWNVPTGTLPRRNEGHTSRQAPAAAGTYGAGVGEGGGAGIFSFGNRGSISSRMAR